MFKECKSFVESGKFSIVLFVTRDTIEIGMLACKFNYFYILIDSFRNLDIIVQSHEHSGFRPAIYGAANENG